MSKSYHQMGLVPVSKYEVEMLGFPNHTFMQDAIDGYKQRFGIKPIKAIVPMNYNIKFAEGCKIQIEPSSTVSLVLLTHHKVVWANGPSERASETNEL